MNQISAKIIADSLSPTGERCTTYILKFPRIVLAEFNTHRMISKNSASSRAIPFNKMVELVESEPFIPMAWMKEHKGMQGTEFFHDSEHTEFMREQWLIARDWAVKNAKIMNQMGLTKQMCNRLLEPFMYHTVIATATEWENFFALRAHDQAEIHIQDLAFKMLKEYNASTPIKLNKGQWHIPFGDNFDTGRLLKLNPQNSMEMEKMKVKISSARCARVSYLNFEGKDDYEADLKLHDTLASSGHMSPFEHCAEVHVEGWFSGNFRGFKQYRKFFKEENRGDPRVIRKGRYD